jgi:hypothetical protein
LTTLPQFEIIVVEESGKGPYSLTQPQMRMIMEYRIGKKVTVNEDGHNMRTTNENGLDTMIKDSYDTESHAEVDTRRRNKSLGSGKSKKTMSTRRCFDNIKNTRLRVMSNTGIVTISGTTIDTRKASDDEFKNGWCKTLSDEEKKRVKIERMMKLYMKKFGS